jgi:D-alanine-D-alanine ligase
VTEGEPGRKRRIVVLFGGRSAEHEISVASAQSVVSALDPERYDVALIGIDKAGAWHLLQALPSGPEPGALAGVDDVQGTEVALSRRPGERALVTETGDRHDLDVVFPVLHGPFGEDGTVQGLLELAGVPYVGADVLGSALGMDKAVQKVLFQAAGLPVVPHEVVHEREWTADADAVEARATGLGLPLFVKPSSLGSSVGISKVREWAAFPDAMSEALSYDRKVLLEQAVEGAREIECSVLGNDDPVASVPGEVVPGADWYDYRAKYLDEGSSLEIPARLPTEVAKRIRRMAVAAFQAVECAGMARVDFFYQPPDEVLVNEINTIPGFTRISMYPKLWEASGLSYAELVDRLVALAIERHEAEARRGRTL